MKKKELLNEIEVLKERNIFLKDEQLKLHREEKQKRSKEMFDDLELIKKLLEKYGVTELRIEGKVYSGQCVHGKRMSTIVSFEIND